MHRIEIELRCCRIKKNTVFEENGIVLLSEDGEFLHRLDDCGRVFRDRNLEAKLACIRLEDEKIFYV